jgi:hypothetical protein
MTHESPSTAGGAHPTILSPSLPARRDSHASRVIYAPYKHEILETLGFLGCLAT